MSFLMIDGLENSQLSGARNDRRILVEGAFLLSSDVFGTPRRNLPSTSKSQLSLSISSRAGERASALAAPHAQEKRGGREEDARGVIAPAGSRLQVGI